MSHFDFIQLTHFHVQHLSEIGREDQFLAFHGTGGLLNLDKIRAAQKVLEKIARYQRPSSSSSSTDKRSKRTRSRSDQSFCSGGGGDGQCSSSDSWSDGTTSGDDQRCPTRRNSSGSSNGESWDWSERSLRRPKVSANAAAGGGVTGTDHRVTLFDLSCNGAGLDLRTIKVLTNGTTVIHCEADGSRGVPVLLRLERSHGTLTWSRTPWNGGNVAGSSSSSGGGDNSSLFSNPDVDITTGLKLKYGLGSGPSPPTGGAGAMGGASDGEVCGGGIEEGYLDVAALKEVALSCREGDFISIARRYGKIIFEFILVRLAGC